MTNIALSSEDELFTWGATDDGALGRTGESDEPQQVILGDEVGRIIQLVCLDTSTGFLTKDGVFYMAGDVMEEDYPRRHFGLPGHFDGSDVFVIVMNDVVSIAAGSQHVTVLCRDGSFFISSSR
jgi:alpha-tubulin suppressor-like RCC1 family protein